jgi:ParE toxin of type II toxin-antitoxin system, parDE
MDKYAVELLFWAEQDLNEIANYYENLSKGLGDKFYAEVRSVVESLKIHPFYQKKDSEIRKKSLKKFPYSIHFRINENDNIVYIEAIISDFLLPFSTKIKQ